MGSVGSSTSTRGEPVGGGLGGAEVRLAEADRRVLAAVPAAGGMKPVAVREATGIREVRFLLLSLRDQGLIEHAGLSFGWRSTPAGTATLAKMGGGRL